MDGKRSELNYETDKTLKIFLLFFNVCFKAYTQHRTNPFSCHFYYMCEVGSWQIIRFFEKIRWTNGIYLFFCLPVLIDCEKWDGMFLPFAEVKLILSLAI